MQSSDITIQPIPCDQPKMERSPSGPSESHRTSSVK